jgi:hypothetical protein
MDRSREIPAGLGCHLLAEKLATGKRVLAGLEPRQHNGRLFAKAARIADHRLRSMGSA